MEVFRLQKENGTLLGIGPYRNPLLITDVHDELVLLDEMGLDHMDAQHPCRSHDLDNEWTDHADEMYCGCRTLEQLRDWFGRYLDGLIKMGFVVVKYQITPEKIADGSSFRQCFFREDDVLSAEIILE